MKQNSGGTRITVGKAAQLDCFGRVVWLPEGFAFAAKYEDRFPVCLGQASLNPQF